MGSDLFAGDDFCSVLYFETCSVSANGREGLLKKHLSDIRMYAGNDFCSVLFIFKFESFFHMTVNARIYCKSSSQVSEFQACLYI